MNHNINGRVLNAMYNTNTTAKSCIKINDRCMSDFFECNQGVRQGRIPCHKYAIFINDMNTCFRKSFNGLTMVCDLIIDKRQTNDVCVFLKLFLLLYADDTIIMAESATELQDFLNAVYHYCKLWSLKSIQLILKFQSSLKVKPVKFLHFLSMEHTLMFVLAMFILAST